MADTDREGEPRPAMSDTPNTDAEYHVKVEHNGEHWVGTPYEAGRSVSYEHGFLRAFSRRAITRKARRWVKEQERLDRRRERPGFVIEGDT